MNNSRWSHQELHVLSQFTESGIVDILTAVGFDIEEILEIIRLEITTNGRKLRVTDLNGSPTVYLNKLLKFLGKGTEGARSSNAMRGISIRNLGATCHQIATPIITGSIPVPDKQTPCNQLELIEREGSQALTKRGTLRWAFIRDTQALATSLRTRLHSPEGWLWASEMCIPEIEELKSCMRHVLGSYWVERICEQSLRGDGTRELEVRAFISLWNLLMRQEELGSVPALCAEIDATPIDAPLHGGRIDAVTIHWEGCMNRERRHFADILRGKHTHVCKLWKRLQDAGYNGLLIIIDYKFEVGDAPSGARLISDEQVRSGISSHNMQLRRYLSLTSRHCDREPGSGTPYSEAPIEQGSLLYVQTSGTYERCVTANAGERAALVADLERRGHDNTSHHVRIAANAVRRAICKRQQSGEQPELPF